MALSKKWKIALTIVSVVIGLCVLALGALFYFGGQVMQQMRVVAQEVYGGPTPSHVMSLIGFDLEDNRLAIFADSQNQLAMVLVEPKAAQASENQEQTQRPFSEPDVQKAISSFQVRPEIKETLKGIEQGKVSTFKLGKQTVNAIKYTDSQGKISQAGILNLEKSQMLFVAIGDTPAEDSRNVANFLSQMPKVSQDPRVALNKP